MADHDRLTRPLLLVSGDAALIRLVRLECREMSLPLEVSDRWPLPLQGRLPLVDLDTPELLEAFTRGEDALPSDLVVICLDEHILPPALAQRLPAVLHRPFATAQLRALLSQWCGGSSPTLPPRVVASAPRPSEIAMEWLAPTELMCGETRVRLTASEAALLRCLLDRRGETVPKATLEDCLRGAGESNKLEVYLCFLRRKLERPLGMRLITTVRGVGYRLE